MSGGYIAKTARKKTSGKVSYKNNIRYQEIQRLS